MSNDSPITDQSLALGTLIGTVNGLVSTLQEQNKASAEYRKEQREAEIKSRAEFMEIFKGMREDNKEVVIKLENHIKDEVIAHNAIIEISNWKKDVEPKVDTLWDGKNQQKGILMAMGAISSLIGGLIVAIFEYLKR